MSDEDFGEDFGEEPKTSTPEGEVIRIRIPKGKEVLGIVEKLLGGCKLQVLCTDSHRRICRIPGKLRRRIWVRETDVVLVEPWDVQSDIRGDIIYRYTKNQSAELRRRGYLKLLEEEF